MKSNSVIYIIAGKNVLAGRGGYAVLGYNWGQLLSEMGYQVKIFCVGPKNKIIKASIGEIHIVGSKIAATFLKDMEMAGLLFLAPKMALAIKKVITTPDLIRGKQSSVSNQKVIILGMGQWSLAGSLVKLFKKDTYLLSDYYTSIKHDFSGILSGVRISDYGLAIRLQILLIYYLIFKFYSLLERFLLDRTDKIITHYLSTEKILKAEFNIKNNKFIRLPYHVELTKRQSLENYARKASPFEPVRTKGVTFHNQPLILLVCRHDGRKGINFLLHAFSILNKRGVKYSGLIVGVGPLLKKHQDLAKKLGLNNVNIPGFVPDTRPFFKKASLFVFPSLEEGSSALSILEAMQQGLPIVSTNIDGIPEDLIHGKSALLVPPKNPQALAEGMEKLLKDRKLAKKLGQNAKKRYYQKYNKQKVKNEIIRFLNRILFFERSEKLP